MFCFEHSYAQLNPKLYSFLKPVAVNSPYQILFNKDLANQLEIEFSSTSSQTQTQIFSGNILPPKAKPLAQAYAGHQFGHFTILGDGRAILLGEHVTSKGERFDLQLKGSGKTPYSRRGDGRAALAPMLREYLISEAMHALKIPTTRSLAVVATGEEVYRESLLQGAILTRIARSHIRVGTFEFVALQKDVSLLKEFTNYTMKRHFPKCLQRSNPALDLLREAIQKQIDLIVEWMRVGFIHGVMNTDNMSLCGETIDYGPCAFMDQYDPMTVFSSIDHHGRYAFQNQPKMALWNLTRFAETLLPMLHQETDQAIELAKNELETFEKLYQEQWFLMMKKKLGLLKEDSQDKVLIQNLLDWMQKAKADYTYTFFSLTYDELDLPLYQDQEFQKWYALWKKRILKSFSFKEAQLIMQKENPVFVPRNHQVEKALFQAEQQNMQPFKELLTVLKNPYQVSKDFMKYSKPPKQVDFGYRTFCGT